MSSKFTYNISFLVLVLSTVIMAVDHNPAAIGTGILIFFMFFGYIYGDSPKD